MRTYYIARKGSNSANQTMQEWAILGVVKGKKRAEEVAELINSNETAYTVYSNQKVFVLNLKELKKFYGNFDPCAFEDDDEIPGMLVPVDY